MKRTTVMLVLTCLIFSACYPDALQENDDTNLESTLKDIYDVFEQEASERGLFINLEDHDLISRIAEIHEDGVAGTCSYNSQQSNVVTIDLEFWNKSSQGIREMVVFHELGHCVLYQGHREAENDAGACISLMNSGTSGCKVYYNDENRDYYLDELFGYAD